MPVTTLPLSGKKHSADICALSFRSATLSAEGRSHTCSDLSQQLHASLPAPNASARTGLWVEIWRKRSPEATSNTRISVVAPPPTSRSPSAENSTMFTWPCVASGRSSTPLSVSHNSTRELLQTNAAKVPSGRTTGQHETLFTELQ